MRVKLWGVRGSIPVPGPETVKYGGNTPCVELAVAAAGRRLIIDAGTGIRNLGNELTSGGNGSRPETADLFLTHTHLDHIVGFPFFGPLHVPGARLRIHAPLTCEEDSLERVLASQLSYRFFPVRPTELAAELTYVNLAEGVRELGDGIRLTATYLNHSQLCMGYRFEWEGKVVCTAYDTEPFHNLFIADPGDPAYSDTMAEEGDRAAAEANRRIEAFMQGADLVIHDAQYTAEEYRCNKIGWGHTAIEDAIASAQRAGVRKLILFHHDPQRTDGQLDQLSACYCGARSIGGLEVAFAREGMVIDL